MFIKRFLIFVIIQVVIQLSRYFPVYMYQRNTYNRGMGQLLGSTCYWVNRGMGQLLGSTCYWVSVVICMHQKWTIVYNNLLAAIRLLGVGLHVDIVRKHCLYYKTQLMCLCANN